MRTCRTTLGAMALGCAALAAACTGSETPVNPATGGSPPASGGTTSGGQQAATGGNAAGGASTGGTVTSSGGTSSGGKATGGTSSGGTSSGGKATRGASTGGAAAGGATQGCGASTWPAACNQSGSPCTIDVNGLSRQYYMTLPTNYSSSQQYPVVFAWHYHSGTAQQIMSGGYYGIRTNFPNAIYVAGQGLPITADGGVDYAWQNTNGRDIAFTRALISWLEANYCVDTSRLFSTGFSYGGLMSDTIACQMGDVFRAIGAMAGGLFGSTSSCTGARIAAWMTHGDADTTVPISTGQAARDMVLANNHCGTTTQAVDPSPCVAYDGCDSGYPVVWCQVAGGTHSIPSYSATAIATFFKQF